MNTFLIAALPALIMPVTLPAPVVSNRAPLRIELPAPALTPTPLTLAVLPALPVPMIPSRPRVPVVRAVPERENVRLPFGMPMRLQLDNPGKTPRENREKKDALEELFDGRKAPVRPEVVIGYPERDLEREIGVSQALE